MAINERQYTEEEQALRRYIERVFGNIPEEDEEVTETLSEPSDELIDLSSMSKMEKLNQVLHDTLNGLLLGNIVIENARELIDTVEAVSFYKQLESKYSVD